MNSIGLTMVAAACLALAAFTTSSQSAPQTSNGNTRSVAPVDDLGDEQAWRERLQNHDLAVRERDFEALVQRAGESDRGRTQLEQWAADDSHVEFAWTCRLALRELKARSKSMAWPSGHEDPFEALRQRMFPGAQGRDPLGGFLFMDPFARVPGGLHGLNDPFQADTPGLESHSDGFSLEMGPDGVKARVKTRVDGEEHEEEYTAKTLDELLLAHPELRSRIGGGNAGGGFNFRFGMPGFDLERASVMRTDVLGVYIASGSSAGQSAGTGLRIERVQPGSLAQKLGLEPGFVLTSLNGRNLNSRDDISSALRERKPDQEVIVEYRDREGATSTRSWTPSEDGRGQASPLQPQGLEGLRKI